MRATRGALGPGKSQKLRIIIGAREVSVVCARPRDARPLATELCLEGLEKALDRP